MIGALSAALIVAAQSAGQGRPAESIATVAGDYLFFAGPPPRFRLVVTPEGRFTVFSLNIAVIEENRGSAVVRDGRLILTPERHRDDLEAQGFATKLAPVRWGELLILVPEGRARAFCNLVNLGLRSDSLRGVAYVLDDHKWINSSASGRPIVPPEWAPMLLKEPIEGRVTEALADDRARVDFGSDRGAMKDLAVWVVSHGPGGAACIGWRVGTVVEVAPASCVIEVKPPIYDETRFKTGQPILTRHPFADFDPMRQSINASKADRSSTPLTPGRP